MGTTVLGPGRGAGEVEVPERPWPGVDAGGQCSPGSCRPLALLVLLRNRKHPRAAASTTPIRTPITMPATVS